MPTSPTLMDQLMPSFTEGNVTNLRIPASPEDAWTALLQLRPDDCRLTQVLMGIRSVPSRLWRRGALASGTEPGGSDASPDERPMLESMTRDRFQVLDEVPGEELVIGVVGQFWRLDGGEDADIDDRAAFMAFTEPGFVKAAVNFRVEADGEGAVVSTETRCKATDPATARRFARYWLLIGWGSKAIRWDMLYAVRRQVTSSPAP